MVIDMSPPNTSHTHNCHGSDSAPPAELSTHIHTRRHTHTHTHTMSYHSFPPSPPPLGQVKIGGVCTPLRSPPPKPLAGRRLSGTTSSPATATPAANYTAIPTDNTTLWNVPTAQNEGACIKGECIEIEVGGLGGRELGFRGAGGRPRMRVPASRGSASKSR